MARLPKPGSDQGKWGEILNDYLSQAHDDDGKLKNNSVGSSQLQDNAITPAKLSPALQSQLSSLATGGRDVELHATTTHLQWRYIPTIDEPNPAWTNLIALSELKGDRGDTGPVGPQGIPGQGVPIGGITSQVLVKNSDTDYDMSWAESPGGSSDAEVASYIAADGSETVAALDAKGKAWATLISEPINVIAEGCVGDGVTDDTQAFTAAWNKFLNSGPGRLVIPAGRTINIPNGFVSTIETSRAGGIIEGGGRLRTDPGVAYALDIQATTVGWRQFAIRDIRFINAGLRLKSFNASGGTVPQFDLDGVSVVNATGGHGIALDGVFECRIKSPNVQMGTAVTDYDAIWCGTPTSPGAVLSSVDIIAPNTRYGRRGIYASIDTNIYGGTMLYAQAEGIAVFDALSALIQGSHVENCWQSVPPEVGQNSVPQGRGAVRVVGTCTVIGVYATQGTDSYRMSNAVVAFGSPRCHIIGGASTRLRTYLYAWGPATGIIVADAVPSYFLEPNWVTSGGRFFARGSGSVSTPPMVFSGGWAGTAIANPSGGDTIDVEARAAVEAVLSRMRTLGFIP
jgi:hypothetical protein